MDALVERARSEATSAVGIGVPSVVEFETGRVVSSVNVPLADLPLRQLLGPRLGVPVFIDNDATVAGLAEVHDEQLRLVAHDLGTRTVIRLARHGVRAGVLGAALLAIHEVGEV